MGSSGKRTRPVQPPATTPEARERQLIAAAIDLAEQQILSGKASSQVLTHFLKLASSRERLEQERLKAEVKLVGAKVENLASSANIEQLMKDAMTAMKKYSGREDEILPDA